MGRLFGTDGIRGIANSELSCKTAFCVGQAAAQVLTEGGRRRPLFVVGGDSRISTGMLAASLTSGLASLGADVIDLGLIPTPAVSYLTEKYKADAGIMISASHNTFEYNGIKIFGGNGRKLPDLLEEKIESTVQCGELDTSRITGIDVGRIYREENAVKDYADHVKSTVMYSLSGLRIALDCANGATSVTAERIFTDLGAEVTLLNASPDGININENCGSTCPDSLAEYVKANGLDCGAAFDGDGDRCICVDENGSFCDGDSIMAVCATDLMRRGRLNKSTVVGTVMTNLGLVNFYKENGIDFIATKVGDKFVSEEMTLGEYSFGGEQSGHIIFGDFAVTGDGQLTAAQLFSFMRRSKKPLSELTSAMTPYPQCSVSIPVTKKGKLGFFTDHEIGCAISKAKEQLRDGRIVVRPSGTEPLLRIMAEGKNSAQVESVANELKSSLIFLLAKYE